MHSMLGPGTEVHALEKSKNALQMVDEVLRRDGSEQGPW